MISENIDPKESLFRAIHPDNFDGEFISPAAFKLRTEIDEQELSFDRQGDRCLDAAINHFHKRFKKWYVASIVADECQALELTVLSDTEGTNNWHTLVYYLNPGNMPIRKQIALANTASIVRVPLNKTP